MLRLPSPSWNKLARLTAIVLSSFILFSDKAKADDTLCVKNIEITDISIVGTPFVDSNVNLQITLSANLPGFCEIEYRFPGGIAPANQNPGEKSRFDTVLVSPGIPCVRNYPMKVFGSGHSFLAVNTRLIGHPVGAGNSSYRFIKVRHRSNSSKIISDAFGADDTLIAIMETLSDHEPATIDISGRVFYWDQQLAGSDLGLWDCTVTLYFKKEEIDDTVYIPVYSGGQWAYDYFTGEIQFRAAPYWTRIDREGNFSFHIEHNKDLSSYSRFVLVISRDNSAAMLDESPGLVTRVEHAIGSPSHYFFNSFWHDVGAEIAIGSPLHIVEPGIEIEVQAQPGALLRNTMISREFIKARIGDPPDKIRIRLSTIDEGTAGKFYHEWVFGTVFPWYEVDQLIKIAPDFQFMPTVGHEYGHYVNWHWWHEPEMVTSPKPITEGWAEFYQFAVRSWAHRQFNEPTLWSWKNAEESPYADPRYDGMSYVDNRDVAGFASVLWNLYDSYDENTFQSQRYDNFNNDDVNLGAEVLTTFRDYRSVIYQGIPLYENVILQDKDSTLQAAIVQIFEKQMPTGDGVMHSAQIKNPQFTKDFVNKKITFSWDLQTYLSVPWAFSSNAANVESGYKLYRFENNAWAQKTVFTPGLITSGIYTDQTDIHGIYKLTATNATGDSYGAFIFDFRPPLIDITGSLFMTTAQTVTWTASGSRGTPTYSYVWYMSFNNSTWAQVGTGSTYSFNPSTDADFWLKCILTDQEPATTEDVIHVIVVEPCFNCPEKRASDIADNFFNISSNYPNPFSSTSLIEYSLPIDVYLKVSVLNSMGQIIDIPFESQANRGKHSLVINATNLPNGKYELIFHATTPEGGAISKSTSIVVMK